MNPEDLRVLAERAETVEGRPAQRLEEVHGRIRTARRRRTLGAVTATAVAVVAALTAGTALLSITGSQEVPPATPPRPTETPSVVDEDGGPSVRPLTYAAGTEVHVGDRTIDAGREVHDIDATDEGAVFVTGGTQPNNRNPVWFTDGSDVVLLGRTAGSPARGYALDLAPSGSIVVWWEPDAASTDYGGSGENVVYDTGERRVVARFAGESAPWFRDPGSVEAVYHDRVYWRSDPTLCGESGPYGDRCRRNQKLMRLDVPTGRQDQVSWATYDADERRAGRTLILGDGRAAVTSENPYFWRVGTRLVAIGGRPTGARSYDYMADQTTVESRSGQPVRLRVPASYTRADVFQLVQWLDDDRVALFGYCCGGGTPDYQGYPSGGSEVADEGDIFVCRLSRGSCTLTVGASGRTGYQVPMAD